MPALLPILLSSLQKDALDLGNARDPSARPDKPVSGLGTPLTWHPSRAWDTCHSVSDPRHQTAQGSGASSTWRKRGASALSLESRASWESEGPRWCGEQKGSKDLLVGAGGDEQDPSNHGAGPLKRAEGFRVALEDGARDPGP